MGWFGSDGGGCSSESVSQWSEGKRRTKGVDVCGSFHGWCFFVNVGNVNAGGKGGGNRGSLGSRMGMDDNDVEDWVH